ncbi:hypothetical protein GCM10010309_71980 [Streptomyces violaceochromogenes]|nr:hypothetical protein GCM10010309_71980 [Streptomyces violaceochromogenes]
MVLFLLLFLAPLGYAAYLSLFQERLIGGTVFVGLDNYVTALKDPQLLSGIGRVALFFAFQVPLMLLLALLFALALDSGLLRLARVIRLGTALEPELVAPGHRLPGAPVDASAIAATRDYLFAFEEELGKAADGAGLTAALVERYPDNGMLIAAQLGAKVAKGEMKWGGHERVRHVHRPGRRRTPPVPGLGGRRPGGAAGHARP